MRLTEIKGFVVYDIWEGKIFQRGHMLNKDFQFKQQALQKYNIAAVIGLARDMDEDFKYMHSTTWDFIYAYNKIPDGKLKPAVMEWLMEVASSAVDIIHAGNSVLSYCNAGRNRSGLMNALIVRKLLDCSGKEAMEIVRRERPRAIDNEHFENWLLELP